MENKLRISLLAFLSVIGISSIANAETSVENHVAIKNSTTTMCIAFSAAAINADGDKLEFGTTEGQYLKPGMYYLSSAEYDEVYLTNLKFYKVTEPTSTTYCPNPELVAEYNFTGESDLCKIHPGASGGAIDARNAMQTIDIHYDLIWQGNPFTYAEVILSCDNIHASIINYSNDIPDNIMTE